MTTGYDLGAEAVTYLDPEPEIDAGRDPRDPLPVPAGPVHAIDERGAAACGYPHPLTRLRSRWPGGMGVERCEACERIAGG